MHQTIYKILKKLFSWIPVGMIKMIIVLRLRMLRGDIGVKFSDDMSHIIVTGHGKGSFDVIAEWDDNPSSSSNGERYESCCY